MSPARVTQDRGELRIIIVMKGPSCSAGDLKIASSILIQGQLLGER